jgi:PAS domain S-box-containing protein
MYSKGEIMACVLMVGDESIHDRIRSIVTLEGLEITGTVRSVEEALHVLEEESFDLVLLVVPSHTERDAAMAAQPIEEMGIPVLLAAFQADGTGTLHFMAPLSDSQLPLLLKRVLTWKEEDAFGGCFRKVADVLPHIVLETNEKGILTFANYTALEGFGYTDGDLEKKLSIAEMVAVEDRKRVQEDVMNVLEGIPVEKAEYIALRKNGTMFPIEVYFAPIRDAQRGVRVIAMDISEQKHAEEVMYRSRMQMKNLFEASKLINSTIDRDTVFTIASHSIQQLVGFDRFDIFLVSDEGMCQAYTAGARGTKERPQEEGLVTHCIQNREVLLFEDAPREYSLKEHTSQIVVPLVVEDQCVGALLTSSSTQTYTQHDVDVLEVLSEVLSSAIKNVQLHHEIKVCGQELEKKIELRSKRIEVILSTRQALQAERNWERGLSTIVESMRKLGFERCGIFLVNSRRKTLDFHFGRGIQLPEVGAAVPLRNPQYFGVSCVVEKKTIHVTDSSAVQGLHIATPARSFVWVPIVVQDEAFAALAADNVKSNRVITEEDVKDLEILAGLCAAFIDRTRVFIEPVPEKTLKTAVKYGLDSSECYIITEKRPKVSYEIFADLVTHSIPGFIITREHPEKIRRRHRLVRTPMLWLSRSGVENTLSPDDLPRLVRMVDDFTKKSEESVILLDGLEYLMSQTSFPAVLKHLHELRDITVLNNARLIIPLHRGTLSMKEYSILEKEFNILESG